MISGVLGGLGESLGMDPTVLRILFVVLVFSTPLPLIPLYIIGAIVMPTRHAPVSKDAKDAEKKPTFSEIDEEDWSDF